MICRHCGRGIVRTFVGAIESYRHLVAPPDGHSAAPKVAA